MTPQPLESVVIAKVADDYRRRGYEVTVDPRGPDVPEFLSGFQPDLIARGPEESVIIEVKIGTRTSAAERLRDVAEKVNRQPGWRFSLVFVQPDQPDLISEAHAAPLSLVQERTQNADALLNAGQTEAAFLLLWSALEGILRLLGDRAHLPLSSLPTSTLIRELYSAGELNREQFDSLMQLLPIRNQLVHGFGSQENVDVRRLRLLVLALLAEATAA